MNTRIIIISSEIGIYVGNALGLGFWSKLDLAGQDNVVTFESKDEAKEFVKSWDSNNCPESYTYHEVVPDNGIYVSLKRLKESGFGIFIGDR